MKEGELTGHEEVMKKYKKWLKKWSNRFYEQLAQKVYLIQSFT